MLNPNAALARLVEVLDALRVPFFVGGSVASSIQGVARATLDLDISQASNRAISMTWSPN